MARAEIDGSTSCPVNYATHNETPHSDKKNGITVPTANCPLTKVKMKRRGQVLVDEFVE